MAKKTTKAITTEPTHVTISVNPGNIWASVERAMLTAVNSLRKLPPTDSAGPAVLTEALRLKDIAADQFLMNI